MNPQENPRFIRSDRFEKRSEAILTRRRFAQVLMAATPAMGLLDPFRVFAGEDKPNSKVAGVQIGLNVPYSFGSDEMSGEAILENCVKLGLSAVELRTQPVEVSLGARGEWIHPPKDLGKEERAAGAKELADWRQTVSMEEVRRFRERYERAGVLIEIVKVDGLLRMSERELDYVFTLAKTLGGRALSTEISRNEADLKRVGEFADKHEMMVGYHGHASTRPEHWERAFALAKHNGANVDLGHFVAGNNASPAEFIRKYHERVTHVHVKDRKRNNGPNAAFGEGETPIKEVLRMIRDNRWNIQATIEFEYKIPAGSDRMTELARAIRYCREALA